MAVDVFVRLDRLMHRTVDMVLNYGSLIGDLVMSITTMGPLTVARVLIRLPRIRGTVTAEWLRFLDLSCLLRLMMVTIVLIPREVVSVIVLLINGRPPVFRWLQFRVQFVMAMLAAVVVPPSLLRTPLLWAVPIPEELEFRNCGAPVTLLTMVMWAFVVRGRIGEIVEPVTLVLPVLLPWVGVLTIAPPSNMDEPLVIP